MELQPPQCHCHFLHKRKYPVAGLRFHFVVTDCLVFAVYLLLHDLVSNTDSAVPEVDIAPLDTKDLTAAKSVICRKKHGNVYLALFCSTEQFRQLRLIIVCSAVLLSFWTVGEVAGIAVNVLVLHKKAVCGMYQSVIPLLRSTFQSLLSKASVELVQILSCEIINGSSAALEERPYPSATELSVTVNGSRLELSRRVVDPFFDV